MKKNNQLAIGACVEKGEGGKAMAMGIRVAGDDEGEGDEAGNGVGDEGGVRRRERWLWRQERWQQGWQTIDDDKGNGGGNGDEVGDGDGDEAGGRRRGRVRVARAMVMVMRVAGDEEAMATAARAMATKTMVAGEQ